MKSQRIIIFIAMFLSCAGIHAQDFDRYFCDSTLRIDYIFSGNVSRQTIAVDELNRIPGGTASVSALPRYHWRATDRLPSGTTKRRR